MSGVPTAVQAALQKVDEPSDEELLRRAGFVSSIRAGPKAELSGVNYHGQHMSLKAAQELEKKDFLARARAALRQSRKAEAEARRQAEQRERERAEFEAGAVNHAGRKALLEAVAAYHAAQDEFAALQRQIDSARVEHEQLAAQANLPADSKPGQQLGKLSDLRDALELRVQQLKSRSTDLFETLRQAYRLAQREFAFLHRREREARVAKARAKLEPDLSLSRDDLVHVAERSRPVLELNVICGYRDYRYNWPYMHDPPTASELVSASERLERQFVNFDAELKAKP